MDHNSKKLLDFIAQPESRGDYKAIYGFRQNQLKSSITTWSLKDLLKAQKVWGNNWGSSAAGRYQIIRPTLEGLVQQLNLPLSTKFDKKTQDYLGLALLKRRGLDSFLGGRLHVDQFALNLAKEWASLPVLRNTQGARRWITRGQSYYTGDGLNKAHVDADKFESFLKELQGTQSVPVPKPKEVPTDIVVTQEHSWIPGLIVVVIAGLVAAFVFLREKIFKKIVSKIKP